MQKTHERIKVVVRCRPLSKKEKKTKKEEIVFVDEKRKEIIIRDKHKQKKPVMFTFDHSYSQNSRQEDIYRKSCYPIIKSLLEGFNCTIFAYGQTGTGKTYTMEGIGDQDTMGIIPRTFRQIFEKIKEAKEDEEYLVRVSMIEIYNEELKDSLNTDWGKKKKKLEIHGDTKKGFYVKNLSKSNVKTVQELEDKLNQGKSTRRVRATAMNDYSSRSHSIFTIIIESSHADEEGNSIFRIGKLNLVDLAGSEKQKQTENTEEALKEGININVSLSNLISVINLLVKESSYIPYRNSKLTKLLADSLGGNSKTVMIANIGPACSSYNETIQTLKYANRAKKIKNKPKINEDGKDALLRQKQDELKLLKMQIQEMGIQSNVILKNIDSLNVSVLQIENSSPSKRKNEKENYVERLKVLQNEDENLKKERGLLKHKLNEQRLKLDKEEKEKRRLIEKYNHMCNGIISKHDYEKDLNEAKEELTKLKNDKSDHKNFIKTKKLLEEKKQQVDQMDAKSKKVQEVINQINSKIRMFREKICYYKQNKKSIKNELKDKIERMTKKIEENRMTLKKQLFYLQNLIPKQFLSQMENIEQEQSQSRELAIPSYSLNEIKKPLSTTFYDIHLSYKNPYINKIGFRKRKLDYPTDSQIYDNGKLKRYRRPSYDKLRHSEPPFLHQRRRNNY